MLSYVGRRLLISVPVLFGILGISFIFVQMLPGDPVRALMSPEELATASPEYIEQRRSELGLDKPIFVQFAAWIGEVLQGNLGHSFRRNTPVADMIFERIGPTAILAITALSIALIIGVLLGTFAALKQNSWFDYLSSVTSMMAVSIPNFFLGLMAIYIFSISLGIFPTGGMRTLAASNPSALDRVHHLILPALVLAINLIGPYVRYTRQSMLEVIRQDYITTARAKGVPWMKVVFGHGLRNALIPLTTVIAIQVPILLTGLLVIETIFSWPGLGRLTFESIMGRDYPVIVAIVFISAVFVVLFNLLADVTAAALDPRIRL
ncbi:ABC transporter permease [Actinobacteria bacterium YIM 96077]|uniref:ABC transporter permease n=1 Tax=Phytoactinopolyspora halophila TaxID=1981511 RepID=A0A329QN21_9ACTN|nr:ABC transporter permease [Actinobacteria bacterium YIM 96077]RAW12008.1 ABC transporter permease [Phytoactinopolyspora halophila]